MNTYRSIEDIKVGDKKILNNVLGIVNDVEKTKLIANIIEIVSEDEVKVEIESSLYDDKVEKVIKYYLLY